jgi:hypothetical protein
MFLKCNREIVLSQELLPEGPSLFLRQKSPHTQPVYRRTKLVQLSGSLVAVLQSAETRKGHD